MKNVKNLFSLIMLSIISTVTYAQKTSLDSVHVQIEDKMELELSIYDYQDLSEKMSGDIKRLQSILKESDKIPEGTPVTITYTPNQSVMVKQSAQNERMIWEGDQSVILEFSNQCIINSDSYSLLIRFNNLENLTSSSLVTNIEKVVEETNNIQGRFSKTYNYSFDGGSLVHNDQLDKFRGQLDVLNFKGGVGVNLIKSKLVMDLSAEVGLQFSKKGVLKHNYYLSFNQLYYFDSQNQVRLNEFANIGYRYNLSNDTSSPNWLGLELGYLVNRHGDLFDKNTFKFGVNWEIGKYISVSPQLYISDKATYPGLRIGFGF